MSPWHKFGTPDYQSTAGLDLVELSLYPYQQEGMLHLAFTGRALLADEMGLGKTVQAVAACERRKLYHKAIKRIRISCRKTDKKLPHLH